MFGSSNIERTITFESDNTVTRPLTLLLAFDLTSSGVKPTKQEQYPVVWKILQFSKTTTNTPQHVTYTSRLAFTKVETGPEDPDNQPGKWKVKSPNPYTELGSRQQTILKKEDGKYNFDAPTDLPYQMSVALNGTVARLGMAFGFYENIEKKVSDTPAQVLYFHDVPKSGLLSLDFKPVLNAYFVPQDYYVESQILTLPIPSPLALQVDLRLLSNETTYVVSIPNKEANITPKQ